MIEKVTYRIRKVSEDSKRSMFVKKVDFSKGRIILSPSPADALVYKTKTGAEKALSILHEQYSSDYNLEEVRELVAEPTDTVCGYCGSKCFYLVGTKTYGEYYHFDSTGTVKTGLEGLPDIKVSDDSTGSVDDTTLICERCGKKFREMTEAELEVLYQEDSD